MTDTYSSPSSSTSYDEPLKDKHTNIRQYSDIEMERSYHKFENYLTLNRKNIVDGLVDELVDIQPIGEGQWYEEKASGQNPSEFILRYIEKNDTKKYEWVEYSVLWDTAYDYFREDIEYQKNLRIINQCMEEMRITETKKAIVNDLIKKKF